MCEVCAQLGVNIHEVTDGVIDYPQDYSLDPYVGYSYRGKPIFDQAAIIDQIDSGRTMVVGTDNTITYTFAVANHVVGLYNNPNYGLPDSGYGYSRLTPEQEQQARLAIEMWDDLIAPSFVEQQGMGNADITLANSLHPAQAYAFYPSFDQPGVNYPGDVFIRDPADNWTNQWFNYGGYGNTTIIHELGHTIGLSHPGSYNYDPDLVLTYLNYAEYAQDSMQYSIMSYWSGGQTGNRVVDWNTFFFSNPQTPMVHDILTIQAKYGADPTTRTGDTTYGFNSTADRDVFDFNLNPFPYLAVYDAGGNDTIDLSGFTGGQFLDLRAGSFSSIGQGVLDAATVNAARAELDQIHPANLGPLSQATISSVMNSYMNANAGAILNATGVSGIRASEYDNFSIAYGVTIENAIGGSARDLLQGNAVANRLEGRAGNDVIKGAEGNDTLIGGIGADQLFGGTGDDLFVFSDAETGDQIMDWNAGDRIDLTGFGDLDYIGDSAFSGAGQARYDAGVLSVDLDGDGVADFSVALAGSPVLNSGDLLLA